ncbi:hypothetical protein BH10CYA1_BH10CYA1_19800 [soil metagenome]
MKSPLEIRKPKNYMLVNLPKMTGKEYLEWGASLMLFKFGLDSFLSQYIFHRQWMFWNYLSPGAFSGVTGLTPADAWFYTCMLMWALPFAYLGARFTLRRLITVGLPPWMVILFFVPFINMIFFVILCVVKNAPSTEPPPLSDSSPKNNLEDGPTKIEVAPAHPEQLFLPEQAAAPLPERLDISYPSSKVFPGEVTALKLISHMPVDSPRAFLIATLLPVPISVLAAMFSVTILGVYGWSVFTVVPFVAAISTPVLYGWNKERTLVECLLSSIWCLMLMASVLLIIPFEGIICLAMATPLAVGVGLVGGLVGYIIQATMPRNQGVPRMLGCFAIFIPVIMIGEFISPVEFPTYENVSKIEIAAPPKIVWKYLIDFPRLKEPTEYIFKTGIAYPIEAKIKGRGPGAIRECIFTTGKFVEPIEIWNEPKLLRFGVLEQAPPMHELSLYPKLHPPHLDHYLLAKQGQFRLNQTDPNHTVLYGTTWYQNRMGPGGYWRLWSDWIIHSIHMRVLNHVKTLSETEYASNH